MKYRKYRTSILVGTIILASQWIVACASTATDKTSDVVADNDANQTHKYDGREPASLKGDVGWLNDVSDDFGRIASDTSNRAVASENEKEVLFKKKNWSFSYLQKTNHFYVALNGETYAMVQTSINNGESYAFAAEGQAENPITLSVSRGESRHVASGQEQCEAELSFWSNKSHSYVKDNYELGGDSCNALIKKLKDYVP